MYMIRHKAITMKAEPVSLYAVIQEHEEAPAVICIEEDVLLRVPTQNYMVYRAGIM